MEHTTTVFRNRWLHATSSWLALFLFLAGCSAVRQDLFTQPSEPEFKSAVTFKPANLVDTKSQGSIVGPDLKTDVSAATKAASRSTRVVLAGDPTPPNPKDVNQIGDRLIAALENGEPATLAVTDSTPAVDPWASIPEDTSSQSPVPLPDRRNGEPSASPVTEFSADRPWSSEEASSATSTIESKTLPDPWISDPAGPEMVPVEETVPAEGGKGGEGNYRLGPGDGIDVTVWEMPELSRALVVRPDGFISFPLIREIEAAGKTPSQLEDALELSLSENLIEPEVNVVVTSVGSKSYYVFGAVANPGVYPHFRNTTLLQSVVTAGGFPSVLRSGQPVQHGDLSRIRIIRTTDRGREIITKNLKGLRDQEILTEDIPVQPEDIIYIPQEAKLVYVFGEVMVPGVVPITDDTRILEALLGAGGVRPTAKRDQILLIRPGNNAPIYSCVNMKEIERGSLSANLPLQNGDIIFVPQKFIAKVAEFVQLYSSAIQPALETYLTTWDAWFVHERFSALRKSNWGLLNSNSAQAIPNPDP